MDASQITQLVVAITALVTAIATLAKVFQHDTVIRSTKATVETVQHQTNSQLELLQARISALQVANKERLEGSQATVTELAARAAVNPPAGPLP